MLRLFLRFLNPTSYESYVAFQREAFLSHLSRLFES